MRCCKSIRSLSAAVVTTLLAGALLASKTVPAGIPVDGVFAEKPAALRLETITPNPPGAELRTRIFDPSIDFTAGNVRGLAKFRLVTSQNVGDLSNSGFGFGTFTARDGGVFPAGTRAVFIIDVVSDVLSDPAGSEGDFEIRANGLRVKGHFQVVNGAATWTGELFESL